MSVDTEDSSYLGFALKLGYSNALRSLRMCVYIYARFWSGSSERIIWPHRQALLQFSLAGVQAGVCLSIPLGQHWCVRLKPLKPRVLFKTLLWERGSWLSTRERPPCCAAPDEGHAAAFHFEGRRISTCWIVSHSHTLLANCEKPFLSRGLVENKHTYTHTYSNFLPCRLRSLSLLCECPTLVLCYLHLLSSLCKASSPQHLTFNPLIPQRVRCFRHCL